jgi:hypothetical protein
MKHGFAAAQKHSVSGEECDSACIAQILSAGDKTAVRFENV